MSLYDRAQAEASVRGYTKRVEGKRETIQALLGDGAGNIDVSGEPGWVWVRLNGDPDGVTEAKNRSTAPLVYGTVVDLQRVWPGGLGYYELVGLGAGIIYENPTVGPGTGSGVGGAAIIAAHAPQHSIGDHGVSGFDPLTVNVRALAPLRARAQTTPNMTVQVDAGYYFINSFKLFPSTTSGAFTAPVPPSSAKYDLLYLGSDDALHIVAGTPVIGGTPAFPAVPANSIPICFVYLANTSTVIGESQIVDARVILTASVPALTPTTGVTSISKSGDAILVGDITLSEGANITLTQAGQDIQIASTGGAPTATQLGQILISLNGSTFVAKMPVTDPLVGWLVDGSTGHLMVS